MNNVDNAPAAGAALDQVICASAAAMLATGALLYLGWAHRTGRRDVLRRVAALAARDTGFEPWAALPSLIAAGSLLVAVAGAAGSVIVTPSCDEPPIVRVVAVAELHAGDLVGPWDALVARSRTIGFAPATEVDVDGDDRIDLDRLQRALRVDRSAGLCVVGGAP